MGGPVTFSAMGYSVSYPSIRHDFKCRSVFLTFQNVLNILVFSVSENYKPVKIYF